MSSENGEDKKKNESLNDFLAEGADERSGENHRIRTNLEEIENEIEKLGKKVYHLSDISTQKQNLYFVFNEYIDEARAELRFYRRIRFFMIGISLGFVAFLLSLLICVIFSINFSSICKAPISVAHSSSPRSAAQSSSSRWFFAEYSVLLPSRMPDTKCHRKCAKYSPRRTRSASHRVTNRLTPPQLSPGPPARRRT